jgi:two-component system KDP operon response regulator KdpE
MNHDIQPHASQLGWRTIVTLDYEPYSLSPKAEHKLKVLNHKPKSTGGPKILIIDDDLDLCLGLRIRLQASYDTHFANDAGSGLRMAFTEKPDVVILDIGLPDFDGYFFLQSLHEIPGLSGVPVIVVTARDQLTHEWRCREAGAKLFFQKPVDNRSLSAAIEQLVG